VNDSPDCVCGKPQLRSKSSINTKQCYDFHKYLNKPCLSSVYLQPTTPQGIKSIINALKQNKASGHDDILPYFLKTSAHIISLPISIILNYSLTFGIFRNKLKIAKVVPVYKRSPID